MSRDTPITPYTRLPISTAIFANIRSAISAMFTTFIISIAISAISVLISAISIIPAIFAIPKIAAISTLSIY